MSQTAVPPSYEELVALVVELRSELAAARERIAALETQVTDLQARLGQNSANSSKPPSSDGLAKPAPKSLRGKSGRGPGRPKGQPGTTLRQVESPDESVVHRPGVCTGCGADLTDAPVVGAERRQVFDLPEEVRLQVTEHRLVSVRCACGMKTRAVAPDGVGAPVQYGPRLASAGVYLMHGQFLSKDRAARALADLFGTEVAVATVAGWVRRCAQTVDSFGRLVADKVAAAPLAFFDETGFRTAGRLHWLHSASTGMFVHLSVHRRRGTEATDAAGILPAFRGVAMHDAWAPYDTYTQATHALCSAHALRELIAVTERGSQRARCAAYRAIDALLALKKATDAARTTGADRIEDQVKAGELKALRTAVRDGVKATRARSSKTECKHNALFKRLHSRRDDYLRWVHDLTLPFDNNPAEQTIRMAKLRIKVSGSLRTLTGAQDFAAIRTYLATADRHGQNILDALARAMRGNPWMPATN
ncbi:IS66 family transposase [Streptomyces albulus]|nr:IS66 family transposase [Streptomyces noursei]